jgi:hypothetical protein
MAPFVIADDSHWPSMDPVRDHHIQQEFQECELHQQILN